MFNKQGPGWGQGSGLQPSGSWPNEDPTWTTLPKLDSLSLGRSFFKGGIFLVSEERQAIFLNLRLCTPPQTMQRDRPFLQARKQVRQDPSLATRYPPCPALSLVPMQVPCFPSFVHSFQGGQKLEAPPGPRAQHLS